MRPASNSARKPSLVCLLTVVLCLGGQGFCAQPVRLAITPQAIELTMGTQRWQFTRGATGWALAEIAARGVPIARPETRSDGFLVGGGEAQSFTVLSDTAETKAIEFSVGSNRVVFSASAAERLPLVRVRIIGPTTPVFALRSIRVAPDEHGAWITRGFVATDADGSEAFIDSSGPTVFGHSQSADRDVAYLFMPQVLDHVQKNGRTEQRSDTYFQSRRIPVGSGEFAARWQLRFGAAEPKEFGVVFDRDLGGRVSDVCERYFAAAVDTLVDLSSVPMNYDPERCLQMLPVRFAAPDAFTPGYGWMMDEYPNASYPFAHDSVWQVPALLGFEGLATGRVWEREFARYFIQKTPLEGPDGTSYFVRRPGGLVRWAYWSTYKQPFPPFQGGVWWFADVLHRTGMALGDARLRSAALAMVRHDVEVKLDLDKMSYPPCWDAVANRVGNDHRDDWYQTPGLAWCAWAAAALAYPETRDARFLERADRITDWFAGFMVPEQKLNYLQGNNIHAVFSHYIPLAFLERFERTQDRRFLDLARDMAWVHILTACTTTAKDTWGNPLTGTTCVGVRGCVDYDCSPNLCHEKDLTFVHLIGPLLDHVNGPAYGKYLKLQHLVLGKDSWKSAWVAEMRDTNMRTIYDTYARGMANLIYALDQSTNPLVVAAEKLVSKSDTNIVSRRDLVLANATANERDTLLRVRFLLPGTYQVKIDGRADPQRSNGDLENGMYFRLPANSMRHITVQALRLDPPSEPVRRYDQSVTFLSDLEPFAAQRGTGLPQPTYQRDRSFGGKPLVIGSRIFKKGLGWAANTVLIYNLDKRYGRFQSSVGVDQEVAGAVNPPASVFFTAFVDGRLAFESGAMRADTPAREVNVDVTSAHTLMLRMSCNWDDTGRSENDHGDWANARLVGKWTEHTGAANHALEQYHSQLAAFRSEYGGARELPGISFFQFGMGSRTKYLYKHGQLLNALTGQVVRSWDATNTIILPPEYSVILATRSGSQIRIVEDEQGVWCEETGIRQLLEGTSHPVRLPTFSENRFGLVMRVLHHEVLMNVTESGPVPNFYVYRKPWYRDGAMMALCLKATGNLDLIRDWVRTLKDPYDRNNAGETEADNLGEVLFLISCCSNKSHPLVARVLEEAKKFQVRDANGLYIKGRSDFADHPVYQTKWLKYGLAALGLEDPYSIPALPDSYSSLFWMAYRSSHVQGTEATDRDFYPYLGWATDHFRGQKLSPIASRDYPLTWEMRASQADYGGMKLIDQIFYEHKTATPHTWHAAEVFLYLLDSHSEAIRK